MVEEQYYLKLSLHDCNREGGWFASHVGGQTLSGHWQALRFISPSYTTQEKNRSWVWFWINRGYWDMTSSRCEHVWSNSSNAHIECECVVMTCSTLGHKLGILTTLITSGHPMFDACFIMSMGWIQKLLRFFNSPTTTPSLHQSSYYTWLTTLLKLSFMLTWHYQSPRFREIFEEAINSKVNAN